MSLGENLQFLRKRDSITQEQLAEKLDVSRQSVSKWESDTSYPEMDKLIQLCQIFHCTIDELVQGNIRDIHVESKTDYDDHMNQFSKAISLAIGMILLGISVMFFTYGMNYFLGGTEIIKEDLATLIFFIFLTVSVAIMIVTSIQHSHFIEKTPFVDHFYTTDEIDAYNKRFSVLIASGVTIILIGVIILFGSETIYPEIDSDEYLESILTSVFMLFIAVSVTIIVYASLIKSKYNIDQYNLSHDKDSDTYKKNKLTGTVNACIMLICTIIYLIFGFKYYQWGMPYVLVYAIGGICCGITSIIIDYKK